MNREGGGLDGERVEYVRRPPHLGALLDSMNNKTGLADVKYSQFISLADRVSRHCGSESGLIISASYKITNPDGPSDKSEVEGDDAEAGEEEVKGAASVSSIKEGVGYNASLVTIFMFYAKMQDMGCSTFSSREVANETMSHFELDKLCRDFRIIPTLLTKRELQQIWTGVATENHALMKGPFSKLKFVHFQDFFVRIAIFAYNKPGLKRMILSTTGFLPQSIEIVRYLCKFMHLDDFNYVRNHIRTVGRATEGAVNARSSTEANERMREEMRADLRANALARSAKLEAEGRKQTSPHRSPRGQTRNNNEESAAATNNNNNNNNNNN